MSVTPNIRRRLLGAALRDYRQNMGFSLSTTASIIGCHVSKLSRIEIGERGIRIGELHDLLAEYGVAEPERTVLTNLASPKREDGWWRDFPWLMTGTQREYAILEATATVISTYHAQQVPDLLQTADYARAAAAADPGIPDEHQDNAATVILRRQEAILDGHVHEVAVVISEGALTQDVGGTAVMRSQLAHLAELAEHNPQVTVQVLPFRAGEHPALAAGGMTILGFRGVTGIGAVHLHGIDSGAWLEDRNDVARYLAAFTQLRHHALTPDDSVQMIREMAK
jgi:transcriptional regulator with XRE-family HTH domain